MSDREESGERLSDAADEPTVPLDRSTGARLTPPAPPNPAATPAPPAPTAALPTPALPATPPPSMPALPTVPPAPTPVKAPEPAASEPDRPSERATPEQAVPERAAPELDGPTEPLTPPEAEAAGETSATSPDPSTSDTPGAVRDGSDLDRAEERRADGRPADGDRAGGVSLGIRRPAPAGTLIWVLLALLGFTLVVQLRSNNADYGLSTARQEDLVRILSDLEAQDSRLLSDIQALESTRQQLSSGVQGREAALLEATKRGEELGLLAGTVPGRGPGLEIVLDRVKASDVLNAVQELRGARGEVMQLNGANGAAVRVVASSYFVDASGGGIIADGEQLTGPFRLLVIGQPETMRTALQIPGGVVASVQKDGGSVTMDSRSLVEVTEVRKAASLQHARPVS